jgi:ABC-type antimicrobial peptide transport system permease subunit
LKISWSERNAGRKQAAAGRHLRLSTLVATLQWKTKLPAQLALSTGKNTQKKNTLMLKNYFTVALRSLYRNKGYALINIAGLSIGIAACLLVFLVVRYERSFDTFHPKKDRIFRVVTESKTPAGLEYNPGVPFPVAKTLRADFPQLEKVASIYGSGDDQLTILDAQGRTVRKLKEAEGVFYADPEFFDVFDFKWIAGETKTLAEPFTVALTRETATRYFGSWQAAMGKTIKLEDENILRVTGILEDVPANTDFPFKLVISLSTNRNSKRDDWVSIFSSACCFVLLPADYSPEQFKAALPAFNRKYKPAEYATDGLSIQPLDEMHSDERFGTFTRRTVSGEFITALELIGLFLLIIACVNFINLATAQAVNRSREVGVRKVLGGTRRQLLLQFMGETALVTTTAVLLAMALAALLLPFLNGLLEMQISISAHDLLSIFLFLLVTLVLVIFLSGFYPALILSGFNPVAALKSKAGARTKKGISLRRGLVVFQFAVAQVLVICMLVVVKQMDFFRHASLGFNKDAIVLVPISSDSANLLKTDMLRNTLLQNPGIKQVSFSFAGPTDLSNWSTDFIYNGTLSGFDANLKWADPEFFSLYDLQFIAGKPYIASDTVRGFVVNEMFLQKLGIHNPEEAIGKQIDVWEGRMKAPIVGVIKDFHVNSLRDPLQPVMMATRKDFYSYANIQLSPDKTKESLAFISGLWNTTFPDKFFEYQFLDEKIDNFYKDEGRLSMLYKIFSGISILISCLGLYGLISFMTVQRVKEVGIRKVLGASVNSVIYLFAKEFILLIGIAFVIAAPLAYYIMNKWLADFAYKIEIGGWIFVIAGVSAMLIALLTVSFKAIGAALANPVKSLRTE